MFGIKLVENLRQIRNNYKTVSKKETYESVYIGDKAGLCLTGNWQFPYPA